VNWVLHIFGLDNGSGVPYLLWSGVIGDASVIVGFAVWLRRAGRQHKQRITQAATHHKERLEQAVRLNTQVKDQAERHHAQRLDQAAEHHAALSAAVAQVSAGAGSNPAKSEGLPADQRVVPPAAASRKRATAPPPKGM
jgi:hypothetical protein